MILTSINYNDLWDLVENWEDKNTNYELGPVIGVAPHFVSYPDSKFDIEDGMAFIQMWSWYQETYGEIVEDTVQLGRKLEINKHEDLYTIFLGDSVVAGKIQKFTTRKMKHQFCLVTKIIKVDKCTWNIISQKKDFQF